MAIEQYVLRVWSMKADLGIIKAGLYFFLSTNHSLLGHYRNDPVNSFHAIRDAL